MTQAVSPPLTPTLCLSRRSLSCIGAPPLHARDSAALSGVADVLPGLG